MLLTQLYVKVEIYSHVKKIKKYLHDLIFSLSREVWSYQIILMLPYLIEVPVTSKESEC
jgi:hypothetical protein